MKHKDWYEEWFNTKYYSLLYKNRNELEAEFFISNLKKHLNLKEGMRVWDNACGKGRHSKIFAKYGLDVIGTDLSESNIEYAIKNYPEHNIKFYIHDMRKEFYVNYFDLVVNIFTSIGYFISLNESEKVIKVMANATKNNGWIVIDFFNTNLVKKQVFPYEKKIINGITFIIERNVDNQFVWKKIKVIDEDKVFYFTERVQLLTRYFFETTMQKYGIQLLSLFGDYQLSAYNPDCSERMIFIGKKQIKNRF